MRGELKGSTLIIEWSTLGFTGLVKVVTEPTPCSLAHGNLTKDSLAMTIVLVQLSLTIVGLGSLE